MCENCGFVSWFVIHWREKLFKLHSFIAIAHLDWKLIMSQYKMSSFVAYISCANTIESQKHSLYWSDKHFWIWSNANHSINFRPIAFLQLHISIWLWFIFNFCIAFATTSTVLIEIRYKSGIPLCPCMFKSMLGHYFWQQKKKYPHK